MGPESKFHSSDDEKQEILRMLGKKFYSHCEELFGRLEKRPITGEFPELAEKSYGNPLLREFGISPGEIVDFDNTKGLGCSVIKRPGSNLIAFEYYNVSYEGKGDWVDRYLIDENGNILATEHRETVSDDEDYEFTPLPINPEELLFKIDHEFVPATQE